MVDEPNTPFQFLFANSTQPMWIADPQTARFLALNEAAAASFGYPRQELLQMGMADVLPPSALDHLWATWQNSSPGQASTATWRLRRANGAMVETTATTYRMQFSGQDALLVAVQEQAFGQGETARLQATSEASAHEAEDNFTDQLTDLVEVSGELAQATSFDALCRLAVQLGRSHLGFERLGLWFVDREAGVVRGSFGTDEKGNLRDEHEGRRAIASHPMVMEMLATKQMLVRRENGPLYNHKGEKVGYGLHLHAPLWDGEEVIGFVSADNFLEGRPITEQQCRLLALYASVVGHLCSLKRTQEAVSRSEAYFRLLIENALDIITVLDEDGTIRYKSPSTERVLGYKPADLVGRNIFDLIHADDVAQVEEVLCAEDETPGVTTAMGIRVRHQDGSWRTLEVIGKNLLADPGVKGFILNARDVTERRQREQELEALAEMSAALRTAETQQEMLPIVLEQVLDLLGADAASLIIRDLATDELWVELGWGNWKRFTGLRLPPRKGISWHVIKTGQPYVTKDIRNDPYFTQSGRLDKSYAAACVPLIAQDQALGMIVIGRETGAIRDDEVRLLSAIADTVANAVRRTTLHEQTEQRAKQLATVSQLGHVLGQSLDLSTIYAHLSESVHALLNDISSLSISLYDAQTKRITCAYAVHGNERLDVAELEPIPLQSDGGDLQGEVIRTRRPLIVPDLSTRLGQTRTVVEGTKMPSSQSALLVPMLAKGDIIGVIAVQSDRPNQFDEIDSEMLTLVANTAAIALENASLFAETHRLLQQTQEQAQQVKQIIDSVPEGVLLLNQELRIVLANPIARQYLELLTEANVGDILVDLHDQTVEDLLVPLPEGAPWQELHVPRPQPRTFEVAARPIDATSSTTGHVLVLRDVTQERAIETSIRQRDRLAAVGQLAAGIAHDFNNILGAIILFAQIQLRDPALRPKNRERLDMIVQQGQRATELIQQILDFSRQSVMERSTLDLLPFLKELTKLLERILPEHINLHFDYSHNDYTVVADPTRLQQVFMNLALNARDAMPRGGTLHIELGKLAVRPDPEPPLLDLPSGHWLRLAISDTGAGIDPEDLPHIFEPFFTTKSPGKGTGLGLAQVYGIVKQHDGHIRAESQLGQGTTFLIYLPLVASAMNGGLLEMGKPAIGGNETLLIVEDDTAIRAALREILEMLGYRVLEAENGQAALALFGQRNGEIDLVISDLVMPEMGGLALYESLQARWPEVKMVLMTGYPLEESDRARAGQGPLGWLKKPFSVEEVDEKLRQIFMEEKKAQS